jgi:hypothetical protein
MPLSLFYAAVNGGSARQSGRDIDSEASRYLITVNVAQAAAC